MTLNSGSSQQTITSPDSPTIKLPRKGATFFVPKASDSDLSHLTLEERVERMKFSTEQLKIWYETKDSDVNASTHTASNSNTGDKRKSFSRGKAPSIMSIPRDNKK